MKKFVLACSLLASLAAPAAAGVLTVRVADASGRPVRDAIVTLHVVGQASPPSARGRYQIEQRNTQFNPFISVVPVNADVAFLNFDPFKHHVYSFSAAKKFELKLFARDQSRSVRFDRAGIVAIGCNIHDQMSAYIFVTDTVWTVRTDASGAATFRDAPERATLVAVWHPFLRAPDATVARQLALSSGSRSESFVIKLRPPLQHMGAY